jgi:hypothetical protein
MLTTYNSGTVGRSNIHTCMVLVLAVIDSSVSDMLVLYYPKFVQR